MIKYFFQIFLFSFLLFGCRFKSEEPNQCSSTEKVYTQQEPLSSTTPLESSSVIREEDGGSNDSTDETKKELQHYRYEIPFSEIPEKMSFERGEYPTQSNVYTLWIRPEEQEPNSNILKGEIHETIKTPESTGSSPPYGFTIEQVPDTPLHIYQRDDWVEKDIIVNTMVNIYDAVNIDRKSQHVWHEEMYLYRRDNGELALIASSDVRSDIYIEMLSTEVRPPWIENNDDTN